MSRHGRKFVVPALRTMRLSYAHDPIVQQDQRNADAVSLSCSVLFSLIGDSPLHPTRWSIKERTTKLRLLLRVLGLKGLATAFKSLLGYLMNGGKSEDEFKARLGLLVWKHFPFYPELKAWGQEGSIEVMSYLFEVLSCLSKTAIRDDRLEADALRDWLKIESGFNYAWYGSARASKLRSIIQGILRQLGVPKHEDLVFVHGPGRVADGPGRDLGKKCSHNAVFRPYLAWLWKNSSEEDFYDYVYDYGLSMRDVPTSSRGGTHDYEGRRIAAGLIFVAKTIWTLRSICFEPASLMRHQKALQNWLYERFKHTIVNAIDLENQSHNQEMARIGSIDGSIATIDLSAASDTVSFELAKFLFEGHPLGDLLLTLRSESVELPDGSLHYMKKYAPMGSALCFPAQCMIFYAICCLVADEHGGRRYYARPRIYGDDIANDGRLYEATCETLEYFEFVPNRSKSFGGSWLFRESCGHWYYKGVFCTPVLPKYKEPKVPEVGPSTQFSTYGLIDVRNRYAERGYSRTASLLLAYIKKNQLRQEFRRKLAFSQTCDQPDQLFTHRTPYSNVRPPREFQHPPVLKKGVLPYHGGEYVVGFRLANKLPITSEQEVADCDAYRYYLYWHGKTVYNNERLPIREFATNFRELRSNTSQPSFPEKAQFRVKYHEADPSRKNS